MKQVLLYSCFTDGKTEAQRSGIPAPSHSDFEIQTLLLQTLCSLTTAAHILHGGWPSFNQRHNQSVKWSLENLHVPGLGIRKRLNLALGKYMIYQRCRHFTHTYFPDYLIQNVNGAMQKSTRDKIKFQITKHFRRGSCLQSTNYKQQINQTVKMMKS